jgi:hydrogenase maturation protease
MTWSARVIGVGQAAAGDDGVGLAILERLRADGVPEGVELVWAPEDAALVSLLETPRPVVLTDAVLGEPPGTVLELAPEELAARGLHSVSTHGMGVAQVLTLARALAPGAITPSVRIVAVTIARPAGYHQGLSPAVAAAVPHAARRVLALVRG